MGLCDIVQSLSRCISDSYEIHHYEIEYINKIEYVNKIGVLLSKEGAHLVKLKTLSASVSILQVTHDNYKYKA